MRVTPAEPGAATTGAEESALSATVKARARRQADALAELPLRRPGSGWCSTGPSRYATVRYTRPRTDQRCCANRLTPTAKLDPDQSFHSLRHTDGSLCLAAGIRLIDIAELMGDRNV